MSKYISIHGIARDNEYLPHLRPAITRTIMEYHKMSYPEAAIRLENYVFNLKLHSDIAKYKFDSEANKEAYCDYIESCYEYCLGNKTFRNTITFADRTFGNLTLGDGLGCGILYVPAPIQLPLRYRDRFHKLVLSTIVLNKLTK